MIHIEFSKNNSEIQKISIQGHANSDEEGHDLVCCAVSVLSQSIINAMIKALEGREDFFSLKNEGKIVIHIPKDVSDTQKIQLDTLVDVLDLSFQDLYEQYGDYITFKVKEV